MGLGISTRSAFLMIAAHLQQWQSQMRGIKSL